MKEDIKQRINAFRTLMKESGIDAAIIPQVDPHMSEYLAPHWQVRRWLSGFTGSAGDLLITTDKAMLWTDSRYFLQAAQQLEGTGIELMKDGLMTTPSMTDVLCESLHSGAKVGVDGMLMPSAQIKALKAALAAKGIELDSRFAPIDAIWTDRPDLPEDAVYVHELRYAGEDSDSKIGKILAGAQAAGADAVLMSALDEIAWTLNIRSWDVKYTPVATAFFYITPEARVLFINPAKITEDTAKYLKNLNVDVRPYATFTSFLEKLPENVRVIIDESKTAGAIIDLLGSRMMDGGTTTATRLKSVKNDTQLEGLRKAMIRDGVALVKFFMELEERFNSGETLTELDVESILHNHRRTGENFMDESFGTIAGYGPHGAIVHYEADSESNAKLQHKSLLLVDSGAQYLDGTTDITRTFALGVPTEQEKKDFTLVMKGHIALATAIFPEGTRGAQLDALARQFLWQNGLNYLHGTGHGVGFFLGVHEGPQSIRLNNVEAPLLPGCITSNEPGLYRENVHGIRCENLILTRKVMETEFGTFLGFETLTLCPFDRSLFDTSIMTTEEIKWVDNYHAMVRERLMPYLGLPEQRKWLTEHTEPLNK